MRDSGTLGADCGSAAQPARGVRVHIQQEQEALRTLHARLSATHNPTPLLTEMFYRRHLLLAVGGKDVWTVAPRCIADATIDQHVPPRPVLHAR